MQQAQERNQQWTQGLNQESIEALNGGGAAGDDDFTKFLELGNEFAQFEGADQPNVPSGLDTPMGRLTFAPDGQYQTLLQNMDMNTSSMQTHMPYAYMQHPQQYQQYQVFQQMQQPYQHHVPPTPVSGEMHGAKFAQAMDANGQLLFDRQNTSFTPLVSPAQTPIDNAWGIADYVVADDFFSPLTSPAIEAQQNYASTNATSSPVDLNVDQPKGNRPAEAGRKPRRKLNPTSRVASVRNLRSVPGRQSTRRRPASVTSFIKDQPSNAVYELAQSQHLQPGSNAVLSSDDSVSPEPLSETLMRPPPLPQSKTPNALRPQSKEDNVPATPATLMRIPGKQTEVICNDNHAIGSPEVMEDISLPAAASEMPSRALHQIDTKIHQDDDQSTPTMSAKTPKLSADSTPRSVGMKTSQENLTKTASRGGRQSKKRQSISQATISPALRPKISPSISPLVPNTGPGIPILSAETSALYLASKSNYQNIIDGTHLPGVSYPETLAENLSSKRTSHKIAEQGRRNRINLALKEIESLLPASITAAARKDKNGTKDEGDTSDKPTAGQGASKASTVEMAIVYIRSLQAELKETRDKLEAVEKSLAEGNSSGSQASDQT
ncbi:hypothetical protein H2198_001762 [Neophaeococcomyces mojaviensis]|uniref:Uncharacterized protein n=1 Tax=Neophaeococcomyces mojaviensis TaxID=3383035 RepID=A0ACC3AGL0_9EURO|nr:hypothetical protein H2198_001762 [Knufia sp. JES_112]